jgi:parvulin-like peptidyl-prolyl isomerase
MIAGVKKLVTSPLFHFVVIGIAAFALHGALRGSVVDDSQRIDIDEAEIARMREMWTAQWRRPPTESELDALIDSVIREEILYREALAMGLDRDDTVVRRRLAQKMEFLADDLATRAEPTREELERFLEANLERYQLPARVSFAHIYFSVDRRGAAAEGEARAALERIRAGESPDVLGDPFMLQRDYPLRTQQEVSQLFGSEFGKALFSMETRGWGGPIRSSYGLHLVDVRRRDESRRPELDEVLDRLRNDLLSERRSEAMDTLVDSLKERYQITVVGRGE